MKTHCHCKHFFLSAAAVVVVFLLPLAAFCQTVTVTSPVTSQTYKFPDPATAQTAADLQGAIGSAETAAKALSADALTEKAGVTAEENNYAKSEALKNDYATSLSAFNTNDVVPYNKDMANYTASGTKFSDLLAKHNKAVLANNALAAKDRKAATVAALNKEKTQIDTWAAQLSKWKDKLDAAKAKLDVKNAALQKQQKKNETGEETASTKLKASKAKLKNIADQLTVCSTYAAKCRGLLVSKFGGSAADTGYFSSPAYKTAVADLNGSLEKLRAY
jgi:hypothetical protein